MEYEHADPDMIEQQTLEQEAAEKENTAMMAEYESIRQEILGNSLGARAVAVQAVLARKTADAFIKASGFSPDRIYDLRAGVVNSILGMLETQYRQAEVRAGVHRSIGSGVEEYERTMAECEMLKQAVKDRMVKKLKKPEATKRTGATVDGG